METIKIKREDGGKKKVAETERENKCELPVGDKINID